jgi:hypothetical protein
MDIQRLSLKASYATLGIITLPLINPSVAHAQSCLNNLLIDESGFPKGVSIGINEHESVDVKNGYHYRTNFYLVPYPSNGKDAYLKINKTATLANLIKRMKQGALEKRYSCELAYCKNLKSGATLLQSDQGASDQWLIGRKPIHGVDDFIDGKPVRVFAGSTTAEILGRKEEISCANNQTVRYNRYELRSVALSYNNQMQYLPYLGLEHSWVDYPSYRFTQKMPKFNF